MQVIVHKPKCTVHVPSIVPEALKKKTTNVGGESKYKCSLSVYLGTYLAFFFIESVLKYTCTLKKFEKVRKCRKNEVLKNYT